MASVMAWIILAMAALAIFHFVYTGIVLPSLRFALRLQLFKLRDDLRGTQIREVEKFPPELFEVLQTSINNSINLLPRLNVFLVQRVVEKIQSDPDLKMKIAKRRAIVQSSNDPRVKRIDAQIGMMINKALRYNMLPWFVYLVPLVYVARFFGFVGQAKEISTIPEKQIDNVLPHDIAPVFAS